VATLSDVERQKRLDETWGGSQDVLRARMAAVLGAQEAVAGREEGASFALRQSLIDLASVSELLADELPPPAV
jgi:hypothetical protein